MAATFTPEQLANFRIYEQVRKSGDYNMYARQAREDTGLSSAEYVFVQKHYAALFLANQEQEKEVTVFSDKSDEQLLAESYALDRLYADAEQACSDGRAEAYDKDLRALVDAARGVAEDFDLRYLREAVERFEPWLEEEDSQDPRENGWVDDRGRP